MTTAEIGKALVDLCRQGKYMDVISKYYSDDIVSVESASAPDMPAEMKGIEAVKGKNQWWVENHEVHSHEVNGPYVGDNKFAVEFKFDVTHKPSGRRYQLTEMALYTVDRSKIVHEHFFYNMAS